MHPVLNETDSKQNFFFQQDQMTMKNFDDTVFIKDKHNSNNNLDVEMQSQPTKKAGRKIDFNLNNNKMTMEPQFGELNSELNAIKEEEENPVDTDASEKCPMLNGSQDEGFGSMDLSENDMTRTSKSAYEHFIKMQQDLQKLMKSEELFRLKCQELENSLEELRVAKEDDEYKLSEATYELDILKHNYDLEMESFGSAVTERESLIEKLQQKIEALRRKYQTLDERLQASINKEVEYKSIIEEAEGRVVYEQMQRQTVIDAKVNELEQKLAAIMSEYYNKTESFELELSNKCAHEQELQTRIDELESSLKNLVLGSANSAGSVDSANGEQMTAVEDEFAYYKNRINSLMKKLETEKQERQDLIQKHEEELKTKDKTYEQLREQIRKNKEIQLRMYPVNRLNKL